MSFFLSSFSVPPFCLFPNFGRVLPSISDSKFLIQLEILNSKFLILNSFLFSPVRKIFFSYWESDFLCAFQSHDKGTTSAGGNHTIPYDSTCYLAARAFWRFAQVRRCEPCLATRLPIMPYISFLFWLERMNSAPLVCDSRREKSIGTMDWCMSFETFSLKNSIYFVPQPRFCMPGGVDLLMLYFISVCLSYSLS